MKPQKRVIFYGNSVVLAGMQASLEGNPSFQVTADPLPGSEWELCELRPDVIIFDIAAIQPEFHYRLAQKLPGLLLIGIDPDSNQVLVWSGQQIQELSVQDLVGIIQHKAPNSSRSDRENKERKSWCTQSG